MIVPTEIKDIVRRLVVEDNPNEPEEEIQESVIDDLAYYFYYSDFALEDIQDTATKTSMYFLYDMVKFIRDKDV